MKIPNLKYKLLTTAVIAAMIAVMYIFKVPCLFKAAFGIDCPGCGMTRAYISLLHLDIPKAFGYNAMFWAVPIGYLMYLVDDNLFKQKWLNYSVLVLVYGGLLVNWIVRLIVA